MAADRAREAAAQHDRPLQDDVIGNAIPGLVVGGVMAGGRALASSALPSMAAHPVKTLAAEALGPATMMSKG